MPISLSFEVECDPAYAFDMWTSRTSLWWPVSHTVSTEPGLEVRFEPRIGGRIFERTKAGVEHDWGEIIEWEPPRRLVYWWYLRARRDGNYAGWGSLLPHFVEACAITPESGGPEAA